MIAIQQSKYGAPERVLKLQKVTKPTPKEDEVLVKVRATAINDYDWSMVRGRPYLYRLLFGLVRPKHQIPGMEVAGTVDEIGVKAEKFKIGDAVFGDTSDHGFGTFASYVSVHEDSLLIKPEQISFEEAAAIPHASTLALQALTGLGEIKKRQKILINGGGGGVGTIGLQLAKTVDCEVTGVDTKDKFEEMRSVGFDHVIDYREVNFTQTGDQYDIILDCKTNRFAPSYLRSLNPEGRYITIGGSLISLIGILLWSRLIKPFSRKSLQILSLKTSEGLEHVVELMKARKVSYKIDGPYKLEDVPRLIQYFGEGRHKGKIVVRLTSE